MTNASRVYGSTFYSVAANFRTGGGLWWDAPCLRGLNPWDRCGWRRDGAGPSKDWHSGQAPFPQASGYNYTSGYKRVGGPPSAKSGHKAHPQSLEEHFLMVIYTPIAREKSWLGGDQRAGKQILDRSLYICFLYALVWIWVLIDKNCGFFPLKPPAYSTVYRIKSLGWLKLCL